MELVIIALIGVVFYGLFSLRKKTRVAEAESFEGQEEDQASLIEASGDSIAIANGLHDIADAIRGYTKLAAAEQGLEEEVEEAFYMDGKRI